MFDPKKFTTPSAKPLPVVLMLDVSGSMSGDKIDNLNTAVEDMLQAFAREEKMETEIIVAVITFGGQVSLHLPYTKASQIQWTKMSASGNTPMGAALTMLKDMIEDKTVTPSRAYRPTIVLVSDGQPNDRWEEPLEDFISHGRSAKCDRMAMAIGRDADTAVLNRFITGTPHELFFAENAAQLHEFFQRVTMSVTLRSKSQNPNEVPQPEDLSFDGGQTAPAVNNSASSNPAEGYI